MVRVLHGWRVTKQMQIYSVTVLWFKVLILCLSIYLYVLSEMAHYAQ